MQTIYYPYTGVFLAFPELVGCIPTVCTCFGRFDLGWLLSIQNTELFNKSFEFSILNAYECYTQI